MCSPGFAPKLPGSLDVRATRSTIGFRFSPWNVMAQPQRGSIFGSIIGILICGITGGFAAWMLVSRLGIDGVTGACVAAVIGMIVATALWAGGSWLLRAVGFLR